MIEKSFWKLNFLHHFSIVSFYNQQKNSGFFQAEKSKEAVARTMGFIDWPVEKDLPETGAELMADHWLQDFRD